MADLAAGGGVSVGERRDRRRPTIADVATRAHVTPAVVSQVLNKDPRLRIRDETRTRVLEAVRDLNYVPNAAARATRTSTTGAIGFIVHDITNPLYVHLLNGAQRSAAEAGYVVLVAEANELGRHDATFRELLARGRIDGVILQGGGFAEDITLTHLAQARLPTVLINSQDDILNGSVRLDDERAARMASRHLLDLGHTRIGFLGGRSHSAQAARRTRGFEEEMLIAGLDVSPDWMLEAGWDAAGGRTAMESLIALQSRPTAVVVGNVIAAVGAVAATFERGVRIPADMSIIAIQDAWVAEYTVPPLTVIKLPIDEMAERAVSLLIERIEGGPPAGIVVRDPPPELILRSSTRSPL